MEIIGMVADTKYPAAAREAQPIMYGALAQEREISSGARVVVRTTGAPFDSRNAIVQAITGVHKDIAVDLKRLDEDLGANVLQERSSRRCRILRRPRAAARRARALRRDVVHGDARRNEIGIRMALGAEPGKVVGWCCRTSRSSRSLGLIVGARGSVGTGRFINTLLYNLAASDSTMIVVTAITLAAAAAIAGYLPARRAARIDPMARCARNDVASPPRRGFGESGYGGRRSQRDPAMGAHAGHHHRGGAVAGARHRRQYGDLLADRLAAAASAACVTPSASSCACTRRATTSRVIRSGNTSARRRRFLTRAPRSR
jgi:hypothetical protein